MTWKPNSLGRQGKERNAFRIPLPGPQLYGTSGVSESAVAKLQDRVKHHLYSLSASPVTLLTLNPQPSSR